MLPSKKWQDIIFIDTLVIVLCCSKLSYMFLTKKCNMEQVKHFNYKTNRNSNGPISVNFEVYICYCLMVYIFCLFEWNVLVE